MSKDKDEVQDYWDNAEKGAEEESGGGVIGKARIELGYWVYVSGITGNDRIKCFFPQETRDRASRKAARIKAQAFAIKNGLTKNDANWSAMTKLYREECVSKGKPVKWEADRFEVVPLWPLNQVDKVTKELVPSAARLVMSAIREHGVPAGKDFYGRFAWPADPYKVSQGKAGMTKEDLEGNPAFPTICIVVEKYTDKAAALETIAGMSTDNGDSVSDSKYGDEFPGEGWEKTDWEEEATAIEAALVIGVESVEVYADEDFGQDVTWLIRAMSAGGLSDKQISKLTGEKRGKVRKALAPIS